MYTAFMNEKHSLTPEEIAISQNEFAKDLLKNGARLVQDPGADKLRVELSDSTNAPKDKAGHRMGGQLEEAQIVNDMVSSNKKREKEQTANDFLTWMQAHPYQSLSLIIEQYGSLAEFQRKAEARGQYRLAQLRQDSDQSEIPKDSQAA